MAIKIGLGEEIDHLNQEVRKLKKGIVKGERFLTKSKRAFEADPPLPCSKCGLEITKSSWVEGYPEGFEEGCRCVGDSREALEEDKRLLGDLLFALKEKKQIQDYYDYLESDEWQIKRIEALEYYGGSCIFCGSSEGLEVHHRRYENLGNEPMGDLTVLCAICHSEFHYKIEGKPQAEERFRKKSVRRAMKDLAGAVFTDYDDFKQARAITDLAMARWQLDNFVEEEKTGYLTDEEFEKRFLKKRYGKGKGGID